MSGNIEINVWRQRQSFSATAPWGWSYSVETEHGEEIASGWRRTEDDARAAANQAAINSQSEEQP